MSDGRFRDALEEYLRGHVVGPHLGADEAIDELPYRRYLMGTLYPQRAAMDAVHADEIIDESGGSIGDETADDPVTLANEWLPSSIGLSFRIAGRPELEVAVWGARYERESTDGKRVFVRVPLAEPTAPQVVPMSAATDARHHTSTPVLDGHASLRCLWRPFGDGWLVTVTLVNPSEMPDGERNPDPAQCLYQVGFSSRASSGQIVDYPSVDRVVAEHEDEELALLYRRARTFAIGHGTSAAWNSDMGAEPDRVSTEPLPSFELASITQRWDDAPAVLSLDVLSDQDRPLEELLAALGDFVDRYDAWIDDLSDEHGDTPAALEPARDRLLARLRHAAGRMRAGISALEDPDVLLAFRLANGAMAMQMRHAEGDLGGSRRPRSEAVDPDVEFAGRGYEWYPFQLAFQLLVLPGLVVRDSPDREIVDLIWFPTGGGKTEAYLAVAATDILLRRLRNGDRGAGTAVITRYTLRLLTAQQFQRAATLICALELIRREHVSRMGDEPIRIGLWVGREATPNRFEKAREIAEEIRDAPEPVNVLQILQCPWCGTEIVPTAYSDDDRDYGFEAGNDFFRFRCPNDLCPFASDLPVAVVDDELYRRPPTMVVGTVDKFARLAWEAEAGIFFGGGDREPPSLIIQDELHLLSGPLGTLVGIYERAVEALIALRGARPKLIASTATIRRADEQVRRLFGSEVMLFPPSGLDADDSFFARSDNDAPGRRYIGLMSQSHTTATTNVQTSTALLLAPLEVPMTPDEKDGLWTLVSYHNTLRELGRSLTQYRDDIPAMQKARARDQAVIRALDDDAVVELTGNVKAERLPDILARLFRSAETGDDISVLVTTNMLSVGVDVGRLGLMLVNGQPKTTAEYIQATSRVGRANVPGTVVAMLSATKPRDRSHYETFRAFHESLYQRVEPTSVTPFSLPARERALHAALVILVRHGAGLPRNEDAGRLDPASPQVRAAVEELKRRVAESDPGEASATAAQLDDLVAEWSERIERCSESGRTLYYYVPSRQLESLLTDFGTHAIGWETPQSMRNVDRQVPVEVM